MNQVILFIEISRAPDQLNKNTSHCNEIKNNEINLSRLHDRREETNIIIVLILFIH